MWEEVEDCSSLAGKIAKDAEILEMAFTAREMLMRGNRDAQEWIDGLQTQMETQSRKRLLQIVNAADPSDWWKRICSR